MFVSQLFVSLQFDSVLESQLLVSKQVDSVFESQINRQTKQKQEKGRALKSNEPSTGFPGFHLTVSTPCTVHPLRYTFLNLHRGTKGEIYTETGGLSAWSIYL